LAVYFAILFFIYPAKTGFGGAFPRTGKNNKCQKPQKSPTEPILSLVGDSLCSHAFFIMPEVSSKLL
jgi:hypothetical protein